MPKHAWHHPTVFFCHLRQLINMATGHNYSCTPSLCLLPFTLNFELFLSLSALSLDNWPLSQKKYACNYKPLHTPTEWGICIYIYDQICSENIQGEQVAHQIPILGIRFLDISKKAAEQDRSGRIGDLPPVFLTVLLLLRYKQTFSPSKKMKLPVS